MRHSVDPGFRNSIALRPQQPKIIGHGVGSHSLYHPRVFINFTVL